MNIKIKFGKIIIKGCIYERDVIILPSGQVVSRPKHLSKDLRNKYGHTPFSLKEAKEVAKILGDTEKLVVGNGFDGMMPIVDDARGYLERNGLNVEVYKSDEAVEKFQNYLKRGEKVALLVHITC